jgi:mRNA-degrading endonuclease RelE of RelBE toxin-antitoxin system
MKTNNIQELFNNTINNTEKNNNSPDECYVMGTEYDYSLKNAIPFIVFYINGEKRIVFGENGTVHNLSCVPQLMLTILQELDTINNTKLIRDIQENILKLYDKYFTSTYNWTPPTTMYINGKPHTATKEYIADETIKWILQHQNVYDIKRKLTSIYNRSFNALIDNPYGHIRGRFYDVRIEELNKRCCFIGSWQQTSQEMYKYIADMIKDEYGVTFTDYYILNGTKPMINLFNTQQDQEKQPTMQDLKKQFFIHLMNQQDKRNALADFRKTRDNKNAKKLGNMTQAQYNALRYVDENKKSNKRRFIFTESQIKHIIKENMNNELANYPQSFNMDTFKSLNSYNKKIKYCNDNLQRIASGSSRIVYKIDDATVLKLAKNQKGLAQNEAETQYRDDMYAPNIFAEVYDNDENFYWIEMQLAKKAKPSDFKRLTGYDFKTFQNFVIYSAQQYLPRRSYGFSIPSEYKQLFDSEEFQNNVWDNGDSIFYKVNEYLTNYQIEKYGDVQRISSWGVVKDKHVATDKLVLIDYGLTDDICNQYYSR